MKLNYKIIGRKIKKARLERRMTQLQLSDLVDISYSYMSCIETGSKHLSLEIFANIANALHVTADELLASNIFCKKSADSEILLLFEDCSTWETRVILETAKVLKAEMRSK